jgi:tape measure domain-containing protein
VAESLGSVLLSLGVDLDDFNAGLNQAQKLAATAGKNISDRLDARRATLSALQSQLTALESKIRSNPWSAAALEAPIKALQAEIELRKKSIALLEQQIGKQQQTSRQPLRQEPGGAGIEALGGALGALPGAFGQVGGLASGAGPAALAAGVVAAGAAAVKTADDFQRLNQQFTLLTGSAEQTDAVLQELKKYAQQTPFDLPGLAEAAKQLKVAGLSTADAVEFTKRLGDAATVTGGSIDELAYNFGQIVSKGQADMVDLRQFAQRNIPIYEALATVTGKNVSELKALGTAIPADQIVQAFKVMTDAGGKFYEGGIRGGTALQTQWASLQDASKELGIELGQALGPVVLVGIKEYIKATNNLSLATRALKKDFSGLASVLPKGIQEQFKNISPEVTRILKAAIFAALPPGIDKLFFMDSVLPKEPPPKPKKIQPDPPKPQAKAKPDPQLQSSLAASEKRLNNLIQLQGLEGSVLTIAEAQLSVYQSITEQQRLQAEYDKAVKDARASGKDPNTQQSVIDAETRLKTATTGLRSAFIEGSQTASAALLNAAERFKSAGDSLRSSLEGAFKFLTPQIQKQLTDNARKDIQAAQKAGIFRGDVVGFNTTPEELLSIGGSARGVLAATKTFDAAGKDLVGALNAVQSPLISLAEKDWQVVVNVASDGLAAVSGDVLGGVA